MENKFKISDVNKQFIIIIYSIIVLYGCMFVGKSYSFPRYNMFIFFMIYGIMGFVLPICFNINCIKKPENKLDKNFIKFSIFFAIGISMILETIIFYVFSNNYSSVVKSSIVTNMEFSSPINLLITLAFCVIIIIYFTGILNAFLSEFCQLYSMLTCVVAYAVIAPGNVLKNAILAVFIFYFLNTFSQMKIPIIMLISSTFIEFLFIRIYSKYYAFGLMHYFNMIFVVVGFLLVMHSLKSMEKIMFYYKFKTTKFASLAQKEMKIIWFAVLILGIFIATYNGRF